MIELNLIRILIAKRSAELGKKVWEAMVAALLSFLTTESDGSIVEPLDA